MGDRLKACFGLSDAPAPATLTLNLKTMKTITLKQAIEQAEERGQKVNFGTFESINDFASYYEHTYLPLLQSLYDNAQSKERNLIGFLIEDLNAITE